MEIIVVQMADLWWSVKIRSLYNYMEFFLREFPNRQKKEAIELAKTLATVLEVNWREDGL